MAKRVKQSGDRDNPAWTDNDFARARKIESLPTMLRKKLRGRPKSIVTKERITIRLSRDVVERFRATGEGWQTRMDSALQDWLEKHPEIA